MPRELELLLLPSQAFCDEDIREAIRQAMPVKPGFSYRLLRRSVDARARQPRIQLKVAVYPASEIPNDTAPAFEARSVSDAPEVHIIGAGPAGLFCALQCIVMGLKPVIIERGRNVRDRRRDLAALNREGLLNPESNYCFGEGGAGTYSDGKLYTRSHKRGPVNRVLDWFCAFGADPAIRIDTHPHIGTNKLPHIIEAIRERIIACGGEVHFNTKLTGLKYAFGALQSVTLNGDTKVPVQHLVLATGHSARDVYELLHREGIRIEQKPFALGVRIEHPQHLIDRLQYHSEWRDPFLPPASYSLVEQVEGRGVFSFCMCPGGIIAPAATEPGGVVVNGWSPSRRNNPFANSGMVVAVDARDFGSDDPLAGMHFQRRIEQSAFKAGGGKFVAPAQGMIDFTKGKVSARLPDCSYHPGVRSADLRAVLPASVYHALKGGLLAFGNKMRGRGADAALSYLSDEALLVATESRTSSPVRIPRDKDFLHHPELNNLYPCAEGAGYAGGIVSAALDGMRIAEVLAAKINV